MTELNCGLDHCGVNQNYNIWYLTIGGVALELEKWAKRTRMPGSEGVLAKACQFVKKDGNGTARTLDPSETLHSIFGEEGLMTVEVVLGSVPYDWSREQHLWYEANEEYRLSTMRRAIKGAGVKDVTEQAWEILR